MDRQDRQDGQERSGFVGSPEVPEKAIRRRFDAAYKRDRIGCGRGSEHQADIC